MTQTNWVAEKLKAAYPGIIIDIIPIKTTGDKLHDVSLARIGGKGVFVKEIEEALLRKDVDIAVHSLKDVPSEIPEGLEIGVIPEREDPRDVLIAKGGMGPDELPRGARIGTGSLRRAIQLRHWNRDIEVVPIRGNLDTRINKIEREGLDGVIVAAAGIKRMGWAQKVTRFIPPERMIPAIGQGALAIELRKGDGETGELLKFLDHGDSHLEVNAERAFLRVFGGGCQLPIAAYAKSKGEDLVIVGLVGNLDGSVVIKETVSGVVAECETAGRELAERLLSRGGREIMDEVYGENLFR